MRPLRDGIGSIPTRRYVRPSRLRGSLCPPGHADRYQGIVDVGPGVAHPLGAATVENELKSDLRSACRSVWASHTDGLTSTFSLNDDVARESTSHVLSGPPLCSGARYKNP